jgi:peptide/nickel transport system ATP-binding protein
MSNPLLVIEDLHLEFHTGHGRFQAINGINFHLNRGELFGVVGETGCGKTITGLSVLRLLPRSARITAGRILFNGVDLLQLPEKEMRAMRGRHIAMIFQDAGASLNPVFTIGSQMERVVRQHARSSSSRMRQQIGETLEAVGLSDVERIMAAYPHQLSGGMKQRAMIAMALVCEPSLIIADEPTTALDVTIQAQILALLRELRGKLGISVLLITHNLGVVAQTCDRLAVLYAGRVVETGTTEHLFRAPHHPYTQGLMQAIPRPGSRGRPLTAIPGSVPANPGAVSGCVFAPRCTHAFDRCHAEAPALTNLDNDHQSACFLEPTRSVEAIMPINKEQV